MTVPELNDLPFITGNIERIMRRLEAENTLPDFFLPFDDAGETPIIPMLRAELEDLMAEYRRRMAYIDAVADPVMKHIFELRFIERKPYREIGIQYGIAGASVKQNIYSYLARYPAGFLSCRDFADRWDLNINTINAWCRRGLFPGAWKRPGLRSKGKRGLWMIPADAQRQDNGKPRKKRRR